MPKLATPVQYEPALEGLNDIRPLQLADEVKIVLPYPVLCKNPPSTGRPAIGKFVRCTQQGAGVIHRINSLTSYELLSQYFDQDNPEHCISFSQKVRCVFVKFGLGSNTRGGYWTDPTYLIEIKAIGYRTNTFLEFVGTNLYVRAISQNGDFFITWHFYGFY